MSEKQPTFTVTDKRKFTLDGDLRDETASQPEEKSTTPEPAAKVVTMPAPEGRTAEVQATPVEEPELQQFTAQETAEQDAAYQESSRQIDDMLRQANPDMGPTGVITFEHIIQSFYVSAMIAMGAGTEPGQKARVDILGARQSIDMLALLQEKTKGNLTQKEEATLQNVLFELRMMFLEITNAIAQSAQRPAEGKKK
ncbi:MAG TPA: DUF1844 domain-containing protein [Acidobacteriaceae bacterium]|jgi:hypothetical protein|nr:DUF1844 domain-containing protein [Acidobacteriaceae bacterium]